MPTRSRELGSLVRGIAQLVEHLLCKQGVIGSNPVASMSAWRRGGPWSGHRAMVEIHRRSAGAISVLRFCRGAGLAWPRGEAHFQDRRLALALPRGVWRPGGCSLTGEDGLVGKRE